MAAKEMRTEPTRIHRWVWLLKKVMGRMCMTLSLWAMLCRDLPGVNAS